jgi:hypothetical protein
VLEMGPEIDFAVHQDLSALCSHEMEEVYPVARRATSAQDSALVRLASAAVEVGQSCLGFLAVLVVVYSHRSGVLVADHQVPFVLHSAFVHLVQVAVPVDRS